MRSLSKAAVTVEGMLSTDDHLEELEDSAVELDADVNAGHDDTGLYGGREQPERNDQRRSTGWWINRSRDDYPPRRKDN